MTDQPLIAFRPGQAVTWLRTGRSGHTFPIEAQVVRVTPTRVIIAVQLPSDAIEERRVKPADVRGREQNQASGQATWTALGHEQREKVWPAWKPGGA